MALTSILEAERRCGQLAKDARVKDIAAYLLSLMYGMAVLARHGKKVTTRPHFH